MTALLGLLAIAGYQNRDKIAEMIGGAGQGSTGKAGATQGQTGLGDLLGSLTGALGGAGAGGLLSGGPSELVDRFPQNGHGEAINFWGRTGPNHEVAPHQLRQAIGPDVLDTLARQTGLSHDELLARLSRELPSAV